MRVEVSYEGEYTVVCGSINVRTRSARNFPRSAPDTRQTTGPDKHFSWVKDCIQYE
jgi:hypothetical protein